MELEVFQPLPYWILGLERSKPDTYETMVTALLGVMECVQLAQNNGTIVVSCDPARFRISTAERVELADLLGIVYPSPEDMTTISLPTHVPANEQLDFGNATGEALLRRNLRFLAPETATSGTLLPQSTVYGLGALLHEMATGRRVDDLGDSEEEIDILEDVYRHVMYNRKDLRTMPTSSASQAIPNQLADIVKMCLAKDASKRYRSIPSLQADLRRFIAYQQLSRQTFVVGNADLLSRFNPPRVPLHRQEALTELDGLGTSSKHYNVWGLSGAGKTHLIQHWITKPSNSERFGFVGRAKLDQYAQRPFSTFSQIFETLMDRVIKDPDVQPAVWMAKLEKTLDLEFPLFVAALSQEHRRVFKLDLQVDLSKFNLELLPTVFVSWSKRLLQAFAGPTKPLLLLIDDVQWMPQEEIGVWTALFDGPDSLRHVYSISTYRTETLTSSPKFTEHLSASVTQIHLPLFSLSATKDYISSCCHDVLRDSDSVANVLHKLSSGNPLFLKSLVTEMVTSGQLRFDEETEEWCCDEVDNINKVTEIGVYLDGLLGTLEVASQELLLYLSFLPSKGCHIGVLASLVGDTAASVMERAESLVLLGATRLREDGVLQFSHDRQKSAAGRLISHFNAVDVHRRVAATFAAGDLDSEFFFEGVDSAITATTLSEDLPSQDTIALVFEAAKRAAVAASFSLAYRYLQVTEGYFIGQKNLQILQHETYIKYLCLSVDICGAMQLGEEQQMKMTARRTTFDMFIVDEELLWAKATTKILAANMDHMKAADIALSMIEKCGYNVDDLELQSLVPLPDLDQLWNRWQEHSLPNNGRISNILSLLAFVGPSLYVSRPDQVRSIMTLAFRLLISLEAPHDGAGYIIGMYCVTNPAEIRMHRSLHSLAVQAVQASPVTAHTDAALAGCATIVHGWVPLGDVHEHFGAAYDRAKAYGNWAMQSYVMMMDLGARIFASEALDREAVLARYREYPASVPVTARSLIHLCLQYAEDAAIKPESGDPWSMSGRLFDANQMKPFIESGLHQALFHIYRLRLAIFYSASIETLRNIASLVESCEASIMGMCFGVEWVFLRNIVEIFTGNDTGPGMAILEGCADSPDYAARLDVLIVLRDLKHLGFKAVDSVDTCLDRLDSRNQHELAGFLGAYAGRVFLDQTGSMRRAAGYLSMACLSFVKSGSVGFAQHLASEFPEISPGLSSSPSSLIDVTSLSFKSSSARGSQPNVSSNDSGSATSSGLDAITLVRSSLLLMEEKDPATVLHRLLQLMCQNTRADYAAIAMCDEEDLDALYLTAAGPFENIAFHNTPMEDPICRSLGPVSSMTQVFRTGRAIIGAGQATHDRFYSEEPKSLLILPIFHQGQKAGVILLSSSSVSNSDMAQTQEVISCLATYGVIVTRLHTYINRLDARTAELRTALEAKTSFLSHCSHELRTPLSAIMGMASVLAASPELSEMHREHLSIIQDSGTDLLTLISDILDQARLDGNQVVLDPAPFSLRDLVDNVLHTMASVAQNKGLDICLLNSLAADPPILFADSFRVKQVLLNFLSNAIKFSSSGQVTIEWKWQALDEGIDVTIDVVDTGIGIQESKMSRLFQTFSQVDSSIRRAYGGSGLGLSIARELARLLGGDCTAKSSPRAGSTFTFTFHAGRMEESNLSPIDNAPACLVIKGSKERPHVETLLADLRYLGCRADLGLRPDIEAETRQPASRFPYDALFVEEDIELVQLDSLRMSHSKAQVFVIARSIGLADVMSRFKISRNRVLSLPMKGRLLRQALLQAVDGTSVKTISRPTPRITPSQKYDTGIACPLQILLVDDNHVNVKVGRKILSMLHYGKTEAVFDGQQAIHELERRDYDLVLLDLQMPVLDGYSAHQQILKDHGEPKAGGPCVVALSANADLETQRICRDQGFFSYLSKPIDVVLLEAILRQVFEFRSIHPTSGSSRFQKA